MGSVRVSPGPDPDPDPDPDFDLHLTGRQSAKEGSNKTRAQRTSKCSGSVMRPQEMPMLMAVSCLSPVIIQTRMPPSIRAEMASGTPSCIADVTQVRHLAR